MTLLGRVIEFLVVLIKVMGFIVAYFFVVGIAPITTATSQLGVLIEESLQ